MAGLASPLPWGSPALSSSREDCWQWLPLPPHKSIITDLRFHSMPAASPLSPPLLPPHQPSVILWTICTLSVSRPWGSGHGYQGHALPHTDGLWTLDVTHNHCHQEGHMGPKSQQPAWGETEEAGASTASASREGESPSHLLPPLPQPPALCPQTSLRPPPCWAFPRVTVLISSLPSN